MGIHLTPIERFFNVQKGEIPKVDINSWRLTVEGDVEKPLTLTYEELNAMPHIRLIEILECYDNSPDNSLIGIAEWEGVPVYRLLEMSALKTDVKSVIFHALDGYFTNHKLDYVKSSCVMLALKMNGVTLPLKHGYPVRLVAPGMYGYKWAKWIYKIKVSKKESLGYWESRGYPPEPHRGTKNLGEI